MIVWGVDLSSGTEEQKTKRRKIFFFGGVRSVPRYPGALIPAAQGPSIFTHPALTRAP